ncbi:MAG: hypothetical protein A4E62_02330 [Syntrophorhabdus sp. PtaU1.Bin002]|nr:MAG: hypothetical protein A4E62_02330 [Syntrophorhabdus sp. PtaU1.Bin002]
MRSKLRSKEKNMKRTIAMSVVGFLVMSCALFAADGDLVVNGNLIAPGTIAQIQSVSPAADISTTSTSFVDMGGMSITLTTAANSKLLIFWNASIYQSPAYWAATEAQVDGVRVGAAQGGYSAAGAFVAPIAGTAVTATLGAGSHTVKIRWKASGGALYNWPTTSPDHYGRTLTVMEIRQ